jgi:hypothetical protein
MNLRGKTEGTAALERIAGHYAKELDAQFGTLSHFVKHAGEIGRAHETFLRGVLSRFLPENLRLGTGFVAFPEWTSRQQDILIFQRDFTRLFEVGECVVIDHEAFVGTIQVKTKLDSRMFSEAVHSMADLRDRIGHQGLHALYAWQGVSLETALNVLWKFVGAAPTKRFDSMPDLVYVRGKYLLMANRDGRRASPPFYVYRIDQRAITEGQALLGTVSAVWRFGLSFVFPWWLLSWDSDKGMLAQKAEAIAWPDRLQKSVMSDLG